MKKLLILTVIIVIILTVLIIGTKPAMHKPVMFSPSQAVVENLPEKSVSQEQEPQIVHVQQFEEEEKYKFLPQDEEIVQKKIKTGEVKNETVKRPVSLGETKTQTKDKSVNVQNVNPQTQQKTKFELPKSIQDIVNNKPSAPVQTEKPVKTEEPVKQPVQAPKPKPQEVQKAPSEVKINTPLTEAEEVIVWNKWRSDLQNKVMRDSRIAAPRGTVFRFSFTVNKFGQISNLKVWSDSPEYTNYAVQALKPLLLSYQGKPILNFPARTKRITTNVAGGFVVSTQDRYTTPQDYSDIERVKN